MDIQIRVEQKRGCGFRKAGAMYFVCPATGTPCCKLPHRLNVCPHCGQGIKFSRGFTWINSSLLCPPACEFKFREERPDSPSTWKAPCPISAPGLRLGLMWVGEKYYRHPDEFTKESIAQGISKRIAQIPHDFEIGKTWIALAHLRACQTTIHFENETKVQFDPGIFMVFKPTAIEYVVDPNDSAEKLQRLENRGITLVKVVAAAEQLDVI